MKIPAGRWGIGGGGEQLAHRPQSAPMILCEQLVTHAHRSVLTPPTPPTHDSIGEVYELYVCVCGGGDIEDVFI